MESCPLDEVAIILFHLPNQIYAHIQLTSWDNFSFNANGVFCVA